MAIAESRWHSGREAGRINHKVVQRLMNLLSLKAAIKVKRYSSWRGALGETADNVQSGISRQPDPMKMGH
jgi:hypothetical protein